MTDELIDAIARALHALVMDLVDYDTNHHVREFRTDCARAALAAIEASGTHCVVPMTPTEASLDAARDWSIKRHGRPIGNADAIGCWSAMISARPKPGGKT